jgi:hypothetical protein
MRRASSTEQKLCVFIRGGTSNSVLANYWSKRPVKSTEQEEAE